MTTILTMLWRADIYRMLALCLDFPTVDSVATLKELSTTLANDERSNVDGRLRLGLLEFSALLESMPMALWSAEYHRLFVNEVLVPPSEGSYCMSERGTVVGDISGFYRAFHMQVPEHVGPPDQLKIELGFMCMLALKEANAMESHHDKVELTRQAEKSFLDDHLGRWMPQFGKRLKGTTSQSLYHLIVDLLLVWLNIENQYWGVAPVPYPDRLEQLETGPVACPFDGGSTCSESGGCL